jgi:hypothetical protein
MKFVPEIDGRPALPRAWTASTSRLPVAFETPGGETIQRVSPTGFASTRWAKGGADYTLTCEPARAGEPAAMAAQIEALKALPSAGDQGGAANLYVGFDSWLKNEPTQEDYELVLHLYAATRCYDKVASLDSYLRSHALGGEEWATVRSAFETGEQDIVAAIADAESTWPEAMRASFRAAATEAAHRMCTIPVLAALDAHGPAAPTQAAH